jgi:hypothetical protein
MLLRSFAFLTAGTRRAVGMAPAAVAVVAEQAFRTEFVDAKTSTFPKGNDKDTSIPTFIFAMLVPPDVVAFIFVGLQGEIVNVFACQVA